MAQIGSRAGVEHIAEVAFGKAFWMLLPLPSIPHPRFIQLEHLHGQSIEPENLNLAQVPAEHKGT